MASMGNSKSNVSELNGNAHLNGTGGDAPESSPESSINDAANGAKKNLQALLPPPKQHASDDTKQQDNDNELQPKGAKDGIITLPGISPPPPVDIEVQQHQQQQADEQVDEAAAGVPESETDTNPPQQRKTTEVPEKKESTTQAASDAAAAYTTGSDATDKKAKAGDSVDIDTLIAKLRALRRGLNHGLIEIPAARVERVCMQVRSILMTEGALLEIDCPMKIVGDIHGQFFDLLRLFELGGFPNGVTLRYVCLGDYVDRGSHSLEVILLLFCYKIKYRNGFYLLRGNHECGSINRIYGFFDECKRRYPDGGIHLWKTFTDVFNYLPVTAIIDDKICCMHGGISPMLMSPGSLQQIVNIKRPTDVPDRGLLCDLLWSDPDPYIDTWGPNDRGVSYTFGQNVLHDFLKLHDLDLLARAHQVVEDGYEFFGSKRLVTIFSAPNYCSEFDNAGAMMSVDDSLMCSFHVLKPNIRRRTRFYQ